MPKIRFVQHDGAEQVVDAAAGQSVMNAATTSFVKGIIGECGGACSCATCHVYVDEPWFSQLPPADEMEIAMLEGAIEPGPRSRLSCQIAASDAIDGLVARIPKGQAT
ncbi:MAG TPA: 2Fe-2S iron-sulfur cluster-binding protein [Steroidobacteraceae bacterium]|nr:2Fe-2S iron-sulfur cluster-binding protein [Steroidobacteraceae bacterium]